MKINETVIQAYLQGETTLQAPHECLGELQMPSAMRHDIVKELLHQLHIVSDGFPTFNSDIWNTLFENDEDLLQRIIIYPVVGAASHQIQKVDRTYYIYLDFICIADATRIVSQMVYIIQNYLTCEIARIALREKYPLPEKNFQTAMDYTCFIHGFANFLSWGEKASEYKLYSEKYEPHKERVFSLLMQAMDVSDKALQIKIIKAMFNQDFWNQFAGVAGMFYFDDIYQEHGTQGLKEIFELGPTDFIKRIFA